MADLIIPDISEFQGSVDWKKLVNSGYPAAIIRAHNGSRVDNTFKSNRVNSHANGIKALGIYQYLLSGTDAAKQANALCDAVGALKPGEWLICDLESGSGDQSGRAAAWRKAVMSRLHDDGSTEELYSGESFYNSHRLSSAGFKRIWVAAYRSTEPTLSHEEWQFTDAHSFPGIARPCDASRFHGTISQLLTHTAQEIDMTPAQAAQLADVHKAVVESTIKSAVDGAPHNLGAHTAATNGVVFATKAELDAVKTQLAAIAATLSAVAKKIGA